MALGWRNIGVTYGQFGLEYHGPLANSHDGVFLNLIYFVYSLALQRLQNDHVSWRRCLHALRWRTRARIYCRN